MDLSLDSLCAAVSEEIGMPIGRVRKVALAIERQRLRLAAEVCGSRDRLPGEDHEADPLRWYPLGANGRLRPPARPRP